MHVVLLGDSIFDNASYVGREPDVIGHLSKSAPDGWGASLLAVDGALVQNVPGQLSRLKDDATHLVISAGGNNALLNADVLQMRASNAAEVFNSLSNRAVEFEKNYDDMLTAAVSKDLPLAVCTVYFPNFSEPGLQRIAATALSVFNDVIIRLATMRGLPVLDLRLVCSEPDDYANEIEPSGKGGLKIAESIVRMMSQHDFSRKVTQIYF